MRREVVIGKGEKREVVDRIEEDSEVRIVLEDDSEIVYRQLAERPVKTEVEIIHKGMNSKSEAVVAGIVRSGRYSSRVVLRIGENAEGSEGRFEIKALVLGDGVVEQRPELDVRNRNVRAGHSASIEKAGDEEMFYLRSRGIRNPKEVFVQAFREKVLSGVI